MPSLAVQFRSVAKPGLISIAIPSGVIEFTKSEIRPDMTITHELVASWYDFPGQMVKRMDVIAHTNQDYKWFEVDVKGAPLGTLRGTMYLWHANEITPVRFDGFDTKGNLLFKTDYFKVQIKLVGEADLPESASPVVSSSREFMAEISRVERGTHPSGDIPVAIWFDVQNVPQGTETLSLAFVTNAEYPQGINLWEGPKEYDFVGHIWEGHEKILGTPAGKHVRIDTLLRAHAGDNQVLAELKDYFTVDQIV